MAEQQANGGVHDTAVAEDGDENRLEIGSGADGASNNSMTGDEAFEKRGVSLSLLEFLGAEALRRDPAKANWSIARVIAVVNGHYEILDPNSRWGPVDPSSTITFADQCSLIDLLRQKHSTDPHPLLNVTYEEAVKQATVFLSVAYESNYFELLDGIDLHMREHPELDRESTYFWFSAFVNDQWRAFERKFEWWATTFHEAVEEIGYTLCFFSSWDEPSYISRVWCLFELSCSNKRLEITLSGEQLQAFHHTLRIDWERIVASLSVIDLEAATSYNPRDKDRIFEVIRSKGGFHSFNVRLVGLLREWVAEAARKLISHPTAADDTTLQKLADMAQTAILLSGQGKLDEAKPLYERALAGFENALGADHPETLSTVNNLAALLKEQGKMDEAKAMYERALTGKVKVLGADHPSTLMTVNNLAALVSEQGKMDEAKALFERALVGREKALGADHPHTLMTVNNLAAFLKGQGKLNEAKAMYERALAGFEKVLGISHPLTLSTVNNLAALLSDQGKFEDAKALYERALAGLEKALGADHPEALSTMNHLAALLKEQGKVEEAKAMYESALAGYEKALGVDHPDTLMTVNNFANLFSDQGRLAEAQALYERALAGFEQILGAEHPYTLSMVNNSANLLNRQGKLNEAKPLYERALAGFEKVLGISHPSTLSTVNNLVALLKGQGKLEEAQVLYERTLTRRETVLGLARPDSMGSANEFVALGSDRGELEEQQVGGEGKR